MPIFAFSAYLHLRAFVQFPGLELILLACDKTSCAWLCASNCRGRQTTVENRHAGIPRRVTISYVVIMFNARDISMGKSAYILAFSLDIFH